eukprot:TRINITY_DN47439_c0_g1_i1.p1 TRINITY_DN47439_c0_g1~~TRINITY_DN47439_c0_g1_i1.p1  ORF type:complete len:657 (-),score=142.94 TRINITY_DN47439_c0_g1_i1:144-2114(-)
MNVLYGWVPCCHPDSDALIAGDDLPGIEATIENGKPKGDHIMATKPAVKSEEGTPEKKAEFETSGSDLELCDEEHELESVSDAGVSDVGPSDTAWADAVSDTGSGSAAECDSPKTRSRRQSLAKKRPDGKRTKRAVIAVSEDPDQEVVTSAALGINIDNPGKISSFYSVGVSLGEGNFGSVSKATVKATNAVRAIKRIPLPKGSDKDARSTLSFLKSEIRICKMLDHPNIAKLFEVFEDAKHIYLVFEYCRNRDLSLHIPEEGMDEYEGAIVMQQIMCGVQYMHRVRICHRDLKADNMLLNLRASPKTPPTSPTTSGKTAKFSIFKNAVRITDFGLSCTFQPGEILKRDCGTESHKAPQILKMKYTHKADIWSCGVIMYHLLSGISPFEGRDEEETTAKVKAGKFTWSKQWMHRSSSAMNLCKQMLVFEEEHRFEASEAVKHKWFSDQLPKKKLSSLHEDILANLRGFRKLNRFKKASLAVIACMLADKTITPGRDLFTLLDNDGDGLVTITEVRDVVMRSKKKQSKDVDRETEELFASSQKKGSKQGAVQARKSFQMDSELPPFTYTEFLAATFSRKQNMTDAVCKAAFLCFDKDGSGKLDKSELLDGRLLGDLDDDEVEQIIVDLDVNGDGELDLEEFMAMMKHEYAEHADIED